MTLQEVIEVPISDLLLDDENARLLEPGSNQQTTAILLAKDQGDKLVRLAQDIVEHGMDPLSLPAVVASEDSMKRYKVLEGNRRILALKSLETPALVSAALTPSLAKQLQVLSERYIANPLQSVPCALFADEAEARHWIELRHTGQNQGIGLVEWDSDAKNRYEARHSGHRSPTGQLIDFVETNHLLDAQLSQNSQKITTNLERLLSSPKFRDKVGISVNHDRQVLSHFPFEEIKKPLTHVFNDLKSGRVTVPDLYSAKDRANYTNSIPANDLPSESTRLDKPVPLDELEYVTQATTKPANTTGTKKPIKQKVSQQRTAVIPRTAPLNVTEPRINVIYTELLSLSTDQYANASSVLLRVFLELSIDHYISIGNLMTEKVRISTPLAKRIKVVSGDLLRKGLIDSQLEKVVQKVADQPTGLAASVVNFNQYVHNKYVFPKPSEIRLAWDELQPFVEKIWL
ncbi:MAG: hypothetical protein EPN30_09155 [Actinomycetota bacterium]|nr:MAG: hypothetical protein EPN30_09155 [Actinomycetota bacterium]